TARQGYPRPSTQCPSPCFEAAGGCNQLVDRTAGRGPVRRIAGEDMVRKSWSWLSHRYYQTRLAWVAHQQRHKTQQGMRRSVSTVQSPEPKLPAKTQDSI